MRFPRPTRAALAALALFAPGCPRDPAPAPPRPLVPLALELEGGPWEVGEERLVRRLKMPAELGQRWIASNDNARIVPGGGGGHALRFEDGLVESNVRMLESFEGGSFDRVRLTVGARGVFRLRVLAGGTGEALPSPLVEGFGKAEQEVEPFEIPFEQLLAEERAFSELVLHLPYAESSVTIHSLELVRSGSAVNLPAPDLPPRHVAVGSETRPAVGLVQGRALTTALTGTAGARFAIDAALPDHQPHSAGIVRIAIEAADGTSVREELVQLAHQWSSFSVPLDGLAGNPGRARIEAPVDGAGSAAGDTALELLVANPRLERPVDEPQTVVFVTSDTHRGDHLGAMSERPPVRTPNLDRLAQEGVLFTDCTSPTNITNPSHIALMTGVHPRDTHIVNNRTALEAGARTLAEAYAEAGYRTFAVMSAFHLADATSGLGQGFERMDAPPIYDRSGDLSASLAADWLREAEDQSVFLWLHVFEGHSPYLPPPPYDGRYYDRERDPRDPNRSLDMYAGEPPLWLQHMGVTDADYLPAQYRAEIDFLDANLGAVLGLARVGSGIVAFTADHGESFGNHDVWFDHQGIYPDSVHVPLILRWPGAPAGARVDRPVRALDVGRTLLSISGLGHAPFPGEDLRGALAGREPGRARFTLAAHGRSASVERDGWLLVMYLHPHRLGAGQRPYATGQVELYHRARDPGCATDLLLAETGRATALRATLIAWLERWNPVGLARPQGEASLDHADRTMLAELGYVDETRSGSGRWWRPEEDSGWRASPWRRLFEDQDFGPDAFRAELGR